MDRADPSAGQRRRKRQVSGELSPQEGDSNVTQLLRDLEAGDSDAYGQILPMVYEDLRRIAHGIVRGQPGDVTLQPTELVHEAFLKLAHGARHRWESRDHFLRFAAKAIRSILVDHVRAKRRGKRSPLGSRVHLDELAQTFAARAEHDLLALHEALERLGTIDPRLVEIVELRFFGGHEIAEIARILGLSSRTIERELRVARARLREDIHGR